MVVASVLLRRLRLATSAATTRPTARWPVSSSSCCGCGSPTWRCCSVPSWTPNWNAAASCKPALPAERNLQLPPHDTRVIEKNEAAEEKDVERGRKAAPILAADRRSAPRSSVLAGSTSSASGPAIPTTSPRKPSPRSTTPPCSSRWTRERSRTTCRSAPGSASASSANRAIASSNWPTRRGPTTADYLQAVADWHAARADVWAALEANSARRRRRVPGLGRPVALRQHAADPRVVAVRIDFELRRHPRHHRDPGADGRHRIPLNDIGEPVLITTGRRLREYGLVGQRS